VVIFLDADDVLLPMAAGRVAEAFGACPGLAKVQFRMRVIDAQGRETDIIRPAPRLGLASGDLRCQTVSFPFDLPWAAMSANAFSAAVLRRIMPVPVERYDQAGADWYLAHVASLYGEVSALDDVCGLYRIHGANRYATMGGGLDLDKIRHSVRYAAATSLSLQEFADRLRFARPDRILSVSDVAGQLTLRKLDAGRYEDSSESVAALVGLGLRAAARRFDVDWPVKLMFMCWFLVMALAPQPVARMLAEAFFVPERRRTLNDWLDRQHHGVPA
jgi:hypothetical protein